MVARSNDRSWLTSSLLAGMAIAVILAAVIWLDYGGERVRVTGVWGHDAVHVWRGNMGVPLVAAYLLAVYPLLRGLFARAHRGLSTLAGATVDAAAEGGYGMPLPHKTQRAGFALGAFVGLLPHASWLVNPPGTGLIYMFHVVGTALVYALAMRVIIFGMAGTVRFNRLVSRVEAYDVLDPLPLEPVTDWSLGLTAACSGGISLSLLLDSFSYGLNFTPMTVATYALLSAIAGVLFFVNTWSVHRMMLAAKKRELAGVRRQLRATYEDVADRADRGLPIEPGSPAAFLGNWLDLERRLVAAPSWPYTSDTLRRLGAAVFMPLGLFIVQQVISRSLR